MKKYFYIDKRQVGKSKKALDIFMNNPEHTLFYTINNKCTLEIKKRINENNFKLVSEFPFKNHVKSINFFNQRSLMELKTPLSNITTLIFDEYLFYDITFRIHIVENLIHFKNLKQIYCFSSPTEIYLQEDFEFINDFKKRGELCPLEFIIKNYNYYLKRSLILEWVGYNKILKNKRKDSIVNLYHNFLTDKETTIIHNNLFNPNLTPLPHFYYDGGINSSDYKKEVLGQFLM